MFDKLLEPGSREYPPLDSYEEEEALIAELQASLAGSPNAKLPDDLKQQLQSDIDSFEPAVASQSSRVDWFRSPLPAWGVAAACFVFALVSLVTRPDSTSSDRIVEPSLQAGGEWVRVDLAPGRSDFEDASGYVEWNTTTQEGVLVLSNFPANDPTDFQYQLWVIDPLRDADFPIDAGVFNVTQGAEGDELRIEFEPRLPVLLPQAFAITTEKPGGVVKSRNASPAMVGFY